MMSRGVLDDKAFVSFDGLENGRFLNGPFTNISPFFGSLRIFLLRVRWSPS